MRILDLYIARIITSMTLLSLGVLLSLSSIIRFIEQIKSVGTGTYDFTKASLFILYSIPGDIEMFFPMAALIGGLLGLGAMASNSELVVMQASGLSKGDIIKSVMKAALVLVFVSMAVGEWLAPQGELAARELRAQAKYGGSVIAGRSGVWAKDGDYFVHIGEVQDDGMLKEVQIYRFDDQLTLSSWVAAKSAKYLDKSWLLTEVEDTYINNKTITKNTHSNQIWQSSLTPDKLGVVMVKPESLSIRGLNEYLDYLSANNQDSSRYQLAFWRKIMKPLTVAVMLLLALSYIFGPLRSVSMGARIMMGVVTGIVFYISNEVIGSMSLVYNLPAFFGAVSPSILFIGVSTYMITKKPS